MTEEPDLSELEQDILKEIINIGLAKVADSFAIIAKGSVLLTAPKVSVVDETQVDMILPDSHRDDFIIQSDIEGDIAGKTFTIFDAVEAQQLTELIIGTETGFQGNYLALKKSLLLEVSNILTGSLVTQFANILDFSIHGTPPVFVPYALRKTFRGLVSNLVMFKPFLLTIKTEFVHTRNVIELPMLVIFDLPSMHLIRDVISRRHGEDPAWMLKTAGTTSRG